MRRFCLTKGTGECFVSATVPEIAEQMYVQVKYELSSYHNSPKYSLNNRSAGLNIGTVVANNGSNSSFPANQYPWTCFVSLNNDFWINLYMKSQSYNHVVADSVVGRTFYADANGNWTYEWYNGTGNTMVLNVNHG